MSNFSQMGEQVVKRAREIAGQFEYPPEEIAKGVREYMRLMAEGLRTPGQPMPMIPTYVTAVPNGTEKGVYLAVDLGGTNFRVCAVRLLGDKKFKLTQAKTAIPKELMLGTSKELFSFLAKRIQDFVERHKNDLFESESSTHKLKLGFTFSFPVEQVALNKGYLIRWTKGFNIPDAIGKDVCGLLQTEIDALELPVRVVALVNDTVGTLMARSYTSPQKTDTFLGSIFGTGTNGAYVEKLANIQKLSDPSQNFGEFDKSTGVMIINCEWGAFDNAMNVLPDTEYDKLLDGNSVNPGMQMFEKRVSGMFLGEILRNVMISLRKDGLFGGSDTSVDENSCLSKPWSVDTSALSTIHGDSTGGYKLTKQLLNEQLGISYATTTDALALKPIAKNIGKRSARLAAVPIAATVLATGALKEWKRAMAAAQEGEVVDKIDIGVDGSLVEFFPGFKRYLIEALMETAPLLDDAEGLEEAVTIGIAKDGSGVGAALIALVA